MENFIKKLAVVGIVAALVFVPVAPVAAQPEFKQEEAGAEEMMADFLVARPLGFVSTVVGSALFVVSLPFSAAGGNVDAASEKMVKEPARFTFTRPLGEF